jgi:hypothetical protein
MKKTNLLALAGLLAVSSLSASAQMITYIDSTTSGTMPGSPTDFSFVGQSSPLHAYDYSTGQTYQGTTDLTDFTASVGSSITSGAGTRGMFSDEGTYGSYYSTISAPVGYTGTSSAPATLQTGVLFAPGSSASDLANFKEVSSSSFNYSDFYVYVMYGNYAGGSDDGLVVSLNSTPTPVTTSVTVSDDNSNLSVADFALFHVTGMTSGETLEIGATATGGNNALVGGVSFIQSIPEPSTWAMLLGGVGLVLVIQRFRKIA